MKYVCQILNKYKRKIKIHLIHKKSKDAIQLPNFFKHHSKPVHVRELLVRDIFLRACPAEHNIEEDNKMNLLVFVSDMLHSLLVLS